jgi:hypothetical protein
MKKFEILQSKIRTSLDRNVRSFKYFLVSSHGAEMQEVWKGSFTRGVFCANVVPKAPTLASSMRHRIGHKLGSN